MRRNHLTGSNTIMKKKILILIIASIPLFVMCYQKDDQSVLKNITELARTCSQDSVRNLMSSCVYISLRSASPYHEGYALCIPTKQTEECFFNVIISATPIKKTAKRRDKWNDGWEYIFKINDDSVSYDTIFHSLEEDSLLFESFYGCNARDIVRLIAFCRQYAIEKVHLCGRNAISVETSEFHLYNSPDFDMMQYTPLSGDWYYMKKE